MENPCICRILELSLSFYGRHMGQNKCLSILDFGTLALSQILIYWKYLWIPIFQTLSPFLLFGGVSWKSEKIILGFVFNFFIVENRIIGLFKSGLIQFFFHIWTRWGPCPSSGQDMRRLEKFPASTVSLGENWITRFSFEMHLLHWWKLMLVLICLFSFLFASVEYSMLQDMKNPWNPLLHIETKFKAFSLRWNFL